jgi:hypothetical protein
VSGQIKRVAAFMYGLLHKNMLFVEFIKLFSMF